jgi:hypothetical protein
MASITSAELRELELRRSQDDLKDLLEKLRADGEIRVVDEAEEDAVEDPNPANPDEYPGNPGDQFAAPAGGASFLG